MVVGLNIWTITGIVKKYGVRAGKYPRLWILIDLPSIKIRYPSETVIERNSLFFSTDLDPNPNTKKGKVGSFIQQELEKKTNILIKDATLTKIPIGRKIPNTNPVQYENIEEHGVKFSINNIFLSEKAFPEFNNGIVSGSITKISGKNRILISQDYKTPVKGSTEILSGTRTIPIYLDTDLSLNDILDKTIYCQTVLSGNTPENISKTFGISKSFVIH